MISTDDMSKEERIEYWGMVVDEFHQSGLTKTAYCQNNEIAVSTFNYWENKLEDLHAETSSDGGRFVELPAPLNNNALHIAPDVGAVFQPEISLLYNKIEIFMNCATPMPLLRSVLKELGYAE